MTENMKRIWLPRRRCGGAPPSDLAQQLPPDWRHHRVKLRNNILYQAAQVDAFLSHIRPGMHVLEAGCGSGWLTLAMAQRGAQATGLDISEQALTVGRNYYESIREEVDGSVTYKVADLNALELEPHSLDVIAVCGALHHLPQAQHTVSEFYKALKPGGLLWVSDHTEEEPMANVLFSAFFMFLLPIDPGYREKFSKLIHFGPRALSRVKASLEGEGSSRPLKARDEVRAGWKPSKNTLTCLNAGSPRPARNISPMFVCPTAVP